MIKLYQEIIAPLTEAKSKTPMKDVMGEKNYKLFFSHFVNAKGFLEDANMILESHSFGDEGIPVTKQAKELEKAWKIVDKFYNKMLE